MEILQNIKSLFLSPRFISFYWQAGSVAVVGLLNLIAENLTTLGLPAWLTVATGLMIAQGTKAISNWVNDKPLGFSNKN